MFKDKVKLTTMTSSTSIILGTIANVMWLIVLIPQLYTNYKLKNTESISLSLVISWIYGDILVIVSGYLKHSNKMVIYGSIYHMGLIVLLGCQVLYYRNKMSYTTISDGSYTMSDTSSDTDTTSDTTSDIMSDTMSDTMSNTILTHSEKKYMLISIGTLIISVPFISVYPDVMADIFGWSALSLFVFSRIPQIVLNYKRKTTHGLSINSFVLINVSNYVALASILVDIHSYEDIFDNIQWIISPFITTILDLIIVYQSKIYSQNHMHHQFA
jgi:uncharacterized protein with PQ loop repeat